MKTKLLLLALFVTGLLSSQTINLEVVSDDFDSLTEITNAGDERLFVAQQNGIIKVLNADGTVNEENFLNVSSLISTGGERGLLGLAFEPDYATNGNFYIAYTDLNGDLTVSRYTRDEENGLIADPTTALVIINIEKPFANHNGGCLRFGPDGYLYVATGDGGDAGDPGNRAQNINELLGKILRLDVNAGSPYIPATNPFVGVDGADEIWAYGLRNPWKFSFNRTTGDLWIADVGQGNIEEINMMPSTAAGVNYGWKCYEGSAPYATEGCGAIGAYTMPVAEYVHGETERCSITGGYVYTGTDYPTFQGKYFFADFCSQEIGYIEEGTIFWTPPFQDSFTTFGEGFDGELYVGGTGGTVYKLIEVTAGLNEYANSPLLVHPNPAENELFLELKDGIARGTATIYNVNGQLIIEQELDGPDTKIDTSKLQSGVYNLFVETDSGFYDRKLVIR